jgi:hypothetical protein
MLARLFTTPSPLKRRSHDKLSTVNTVVVVPMERTDKVKDSPSMVDRTTAAWVVGGTWVGMLQTVDTFRLKLTNTVDRDSETNI